MGAVHSSRIVSIIDPDPDPVKLASCTRNNRPGSAWKHEQASEMMFDALVRENKVPISVKDQDFVKALIAGKPLRTYVI